MSDTSPSLLQQLANKAKLFHEHSGISKSKMAKAILVEPGNYSSFLNGKRGLSAESTCLLLKFVNMPANQAVAAFSKPTSTSRILKLQQFKNGLHLDNNLGMACWEIWFQWSSFGFGFLFLSHIRGNGYLILFFSLFHFFTVSTVSSAL
jgi:hypothetical protein